MISEFADRCPRSRTLPSRPSHTLYRQQEWVSKVFRDEVTRCSPASPAKTSGPSLLAGMTGGGSARQCPASFVVSARRTSAFAMSMRLRMVIVDEYDMLRVVRVSAGTFIISTGYWLVGKWIGHTTVVLEYSAATKVWKRAGEDGTSWPWAIYAFAFPHENQRENHALGSERAIKLREPAARRPRSLRSQRRGYGDGGGSITHPISLFGMFSGGVKGAAAGRRMQDVWKARAREGGNVSSHILRRMRTSRLL